MFRFLTFISSTTAFLALFFLLPEPICGTSVVTTASQTGSESYELLIGWKAEVSTAERDRTIAAWGGKLKRRFSIIPADVVQFGSIKDMKAAQTAIALHSGVAVIEEEENAADDADRVNGVKGRDSIDFVPFPSNLQPSTEPGRSITAGADAYTQRFPNASWRHADLVHEAQEFARQKREVIIAIISDKPQATSWLFYDRKLIQPVLWENPREKNGKKGVDDDGNGYIDDIHGINTIHIPNGLLSFSAENITVIAGVANYLPDHLTNTAGLVKLMPITAFHELDGEDYCYHSWPVVRTTDAALIEALDYAARMGAKVAYVSGHYAYRKSPLVVAAAAAFPGLIITATDRDIDQECFGDSSMLLQSGLDNVIGVGGFDPVTSKMIWNYGGTVDLTASPAREHYYSGGGASDCGAKVAGVAAHLMSCYPHLTRGQIKDLILGGTDRLPDPRATPSDRRFGNRTRGKLNAARAVLGRSAGGSFYIGDWALVDRSGPILRYGFGLAYDPQRSLLYLYGGLGNDPATGHSKIYDDFWCWNGSRWREIIQVKKPGKYPGAVDMLGRPIPLLYDKNRRELILVAPDAVWRWDGVRWRSQPAPLPDDGDRIMFYSANDVAFDALRDRLVMFYKFNERGPRMLELDGNGWIMSNELVPAPDRGIMSSIAQYPSPLRYNDKLGKVTVITSSEDRLYSSYLWGYDGDGWQLLPPIDPVVGANGQYLCDGQQNRYIRFGSDNYDAVARGTDGEVPYWDGNDIWELKDGQWRCLGYDAPAAVFEDILYSMAWADDRQVALLVGYQYSASSHLFTWQYSGAITPTWIDNLILPHGDYTGDGRADSAIWHPETGEFAIRGGASATIGAWGDIPAPGDYDGDGCVDFVVCRRLPGTKVLDDGSMLWIFADNQISFGQFYDIPVPLDYDGDGKTDIAVYRKDTAKWLFKGKNKPVSFGNPADLPVPADYDGDGRPELATYSPLTSTWHIQGIGDIQWGEPGDSPIPADYDGDGRKEIATWNPRTATWLVRDWRDGGKLINKTFGEKWDIPVPGDYNGDGKAELATYSPITCLWRIQGREPVKFGSPGDVPLVRGN